MSIELGNLHISTRSLVQNPDSEFESGGSGGGCGRLTLTGGEELLPAIFFHVLPTSPLIY